jgi:ATP-dependent Clp protease ATP-binding subunit ClpA
VFERFTERARQVVVLAQDESRTLRHNYIGTEHLLLGLLREEEGLAARVLDELGIAVDEVRAMVARVVGRGDEIATGQIPFTPRAKKALELALREALSLGHNYVGTEHLLLGLVRENSGVAARILLDFGVDAEAVRGATILLLSGSRAPAKEWRVSNERLEAEAATKNPALAERLTRARSDKERALEAGDFDGAARARQEEVALRRSLLGLPEPAPVRPREMVAVRTTAFRPSVALLVAGAGIFLVAAGIGLLLGYLIWH